MDALSLQERIAGDKDGILEIIESLGYTQIKESQKYFSFPRLDGDNLGFIKMGVLYKRRIWKYIYINHEYQKYEFSRFS